MNVPMMSAFPTAPTASCVPYTVACSEIWGSNRAISQMIYMPGLKGWIYATPYEAEHGGGDVHQFSVCSNAFLARVALADVSGHGPKVDAVAQSLIRLMQKHMDTLDQTNFMQELDRDLYAETGGEHYATAFLLSYYQPINRLLFTNAGHLPPLWYRAQQRSWTFLAEVEHATDLGFTGLPIGLIEGTKHRQDMIPFESGDLLILYTDAIVETSSVWGQTLSFRQLLHIAECLPVHDAFDTFDAFHAAIKNFRGLAQASDDETIIVLQCTPDAQ